MGHCIISGNSVRTSVVGLLKITDQFYIGDLVECLYLSCIGLTVCGGSGFVSLSFFFTSHLALSGLYRFCSFSQQLPICVSCPCLSTLDYYETTINFAFLKPFTHLIFSHNISRSCFRELGIMTPDHA